MSTTTQRPPGGRPLRRAEREIAPSELDAVFAEAQVLFLSLRDEPAPYVVPVCFGYESGVLYVHSARAGTKMDLLRAHPVVGFSASTNMEIVPGDSACDFGCRAHSVAGTATARIVEDDTGRARGLDAIMRHYAAATPDASADAAARGAPGPVHAYKAGPLARTCVIALRIDTVRGKRTG
jgi:hypothetical protein